MADTPANRAPMAQHETVLRTSWLLLLRNIALAAGLGVGGFVMVQTDETVVIVIGAIMLLASPIFLAMPLFLGLPGRGACPECGGAIESQSATATALLCRSCATYLDAAGGKLRASPPSSNGVLPVFAAPTPWDDLSLVVFSTLGFSPQDKVQDALTTVSAGTRLMDPIWPQGCCVCQATAVRRDTVKRAIAKPGLVIDKEITLVLKDVPYCAQHKDSVAFDRVSSDTPGAGDGFGLRFRSLAYRNAFMKLNPWRFTWHDEPRTQHPTREDSTAATKRGNALRDSGDLVGAKACYEQSWRTDERLARENPASSQAQRDLSISCNNLGDIARASGDLTGAKAFYEKALQLREVQLRNNPASDEAQRDLSVSYERLGNLARDTGDLADARACFEQCVAIDERLAHAPAANPSAERELTISCNRLGQTLQDSGDLAGARRRYTQGLEIRRRLASNAPTDVDAQRDLTLSLEQLGDLAAIEGDITGAIAWYQKSQAITRPLADAHPASSQLQNDARITDQRLAKLLEGK